MTQIQDAFPKLPSDSPLYLRIKVTPRQPKTEFFWIMDDGTLKIRLKAVPEKWKANSELVRFLGEVYGVKSASIEIISGAWESVKLVRIQTKS